MPSTLPRRLLVCIGERRRDSDRMRPRTGKFCPREFRGSSRAERGLWNGVAARGTVWHERAREGCRKNLEIAASFRRVAPLWIDGCAVVPAVVPWLHECGQAV